MNYELTRGYQHSKRDKDGKRRSYRTFYLNDVLILKQKSPFHARGCNAGADGKSWTGDIYLLNNNLHQTRSNNRCGVRGDKERDVKYPLSKKTLEQFNIPKDLKIEETFG